MSNVASLGGSLASGLLSGPDPFTSPDSFDTIAAGGLTFSSKIEVRRCHRPYRWHTKKASGQEGATQTYRGKTPPQFEITVYLWTPTQFANWYLFSNVFVYQGIIGKVLPVQIYHPVLAMVGVNQVVCLRLGAPERVSDDGMWKVEVELEEFFPPLPAPATVTPIKAVTGSTGFSIPVDPIAAQLQAAIAAQTALLTQNGLAVGSGL